MSGIYGIKRGADVELGDVEVLLHFTPSRGSIGDETFTKLNTKDVLMTNKNPNGGANEILGGIYTLKLPTDIFGYKGYYTILIRPIEIRTKISDVGVLSSQSDIKGIVIDPSGLESNLINKFKNNGLIGYRVEYLNGGVGASPQISTLNTLGFDNDNSFTAGGRPSGLSGRPDPTGGDGTLDPTDWWGDGVPDYNEDGDEGYDQDPDPDPPSYDPDNPPNDPDPEPPNNGDILEPIDPNPTPPIISTGTTITPRKNSGNKINNLFRIITSNNKAEPVNQNLTNTNQKAIRYRFNDNSNLIFATLTPSSSNSVKPNVTPFIGEPNQDIILTNTFFNPVMLEIEMVEHDIETIAYGIFGGQTKSLEDGIYTIYNFNNEIYKQYNMFEIKEEFSGKPLYEVREARVNIDFNKEFNEINNI